MERITREFLSKREPDRRAEPSLVQLQESVPLDRVVSVIGAACTVAPDQILRRVGCHREARRMGMYLASLHCRRGSPLTALAEPFAVAVSGLTRARGRLEGQLRQDRALRKMVNELERIVKSNA